MRRLALVWFLSTSFAALANDVPTCAPDLQLLDDSCPFHSPYKPRPEPKLDPRPAGPEADGVVLQEGRSSEASKRLYLFVMQVFQRPLPGLKHGGDWVKHR